jgi:hypothetical protein
MPIAVAGTTIERNASVSRRKLRPSTKRSTSGSQKFTVSW